MATHQIRQKKGTKKVDYSKRGRARAIRFMCVECMGFQANAVKGCTNITCPLFPYRNGPMARPDFGEYEVQGGNLYKLVKGRRRKHG